ncbi:MAG TPA: di-heme oxidoredictase family protein, partial [Herpetosiphonaceae bacterium]|nr:di-heme oxidoredictase family protein [Herpetosiphonaceae bacterium]
GLDGLSPAGTIARLPDEAPGVIGIAFKWNPERVLYIADPARDRLVLLHLSDDQRHFTVTHRSAITSPELKQPVDLAAAVPEIANPHFASHTTLAGGSDLYVLNRGDGSLVRLSQAGHVLARAEIDVPGVGRVSGGRVRAMAVSADAQRIWLTLEGELPGFPGHEGALIEVGAFDASGPFDRNPTETLQAAGSAPSAGAVAFHAEYTPETGLGPLFNAQSCAACHPGPGGASTSEEHFVRRVARMDPGTGRVTMLDHPNSPVARRRSVLDFGHRNAPSADMPRSANVTSLRMPLALYSSGRLEEIPDAVIEAQAVAKGDGIHGRAHYVTSVNGEQRIGRYGWKAQIATLDEMVADAFANEIGISNPLTPEPAPSAGSPEDDGSLVRAVAAYLRTLQPPGNVSP